jgi:transposase
MNGDVVVAAAHAGRSAGVSGCADIVSVPLRGAEDAMVGESRWDEIRRMRAEGMSVSKIARVADLDRKTVRRCLSRAQWAPYRRRAKEVTLLAAHQRWLVERAPEVNYSAQILFQELRAQRGFAGGYDTVKNAVRPLRMEVAADLLTQTRFETDPGEQSQVDWGEVRVPFGDEIVRVQVFVMTLGYSRRAWVEGFANEQMASLLTAHEHAFEHFGGRTREMLYDRMRTVVIVEPGGKRRWNPTFDAFAKFWGFEPRLCRAYRAQTKGKVESGVKYVKRNFVPGRSFRDLDDFNEQLRAWNTEIADVRIHGTTHERPIERFAREAPALAATHGQPSFLQAMQRDRVVADDWLVSIDTNRYSVPWRLVGKTVQVARLGLTWQILYRGSLVAEHEAMAGKYQLSIKPEHGPGPAMRNARRIFAGPPPIPKPGAAPAPVVQIRDLCLYDQILEAV